MSLGVVTSKRYLFEGRCPVLGTFHYQLPSLFLLNEIIFFKSSNLTDFFNKLGFDAMHNSSKTALFN